MTRVAIETAWVATSRLRPQRLDRAFPEVKPVTWEADHFSALLMSSGRSPLLMLFVLTRVRAALHQRVPQARATTCKTAPNQAFSKSLHGGRRHADGLMALKWRTEFQR